MTPLAARLQLLRTHSGLSQAQLSRMAGLSRTVVRVLEEKDRPSPGATTVLALARTLGTTAEWLVEGRGPTPTREHVRAAVEAATRAFRPTDAERDPRIHADALAALGISLEREAV